MNKEEQFTWEAEQIRKVEREQVIKIIEGMEVNLCQCRKPDPEMNRCMNCRLVIENKMTIEQTLSDIIEKIKQL